MRPGGCESSRSTTLPHFPAGRAGVGKSSANVPRRFTELRAGPHVDAAVVFAAQTETFRLRHRANITAVPAETVLLKFSPSARA